MKRRFFTWLARQLQPQIEAAIAAELERRDIAGQIEQLKAATRSQAQRSAQSARRFIGDV